MRRVKYFCTNGETGYLLFEDVWFFLNKNIHLPEARRLLSELEN